MNYSFISSTSRFLFACTTGLFISCSTTSFNGHDVCADTVFNQTLSKNRLGLMALEPSSELSSLIHRWCLAMQTPCTLHLLDKDEPMALSPKAGDIYVSKGLLEITGETSDQLLFVVTHELAHGILGHFNESCGTLSELEREKKADEYALLYLYKKARRYRDIPELLELLTRSSQIDEKGRVLLQKRAANLREMIGKLH